ncbi:MAG: hypothetical protein AAB618_01805 [Patescibacteria group bacterium]
MICIEEFRAIVDCALEDQRAFEAVENVDVLKKAVNELYHRIPLEELIKRLTSSEHCAELCLHLNRKTFRGEEARTALRRMGNNPGAISHHDNTASDALCEVVNALWRHSINEYIIRDDFRRAWDEIKAAFRGFDAPKYEAGQPPEQGELCAASDTIEDSVRLLFDGMQKAGLVEALKSQSRRVPYSWSDFPVVPPVAGWPWAAALQGGADRSYYTPISYLASTGIKVLAIVAGLNAVRAKKPSRKKSKG